MRISDWSSECALPISRAVPVQGTGQARAGGAGAPAGVGARQGGGGRARRCAARVGRDRILLWYPPFAKGGIYLRSKEHTSELQSLMRISYAVFCLTKNKNKTQMSTHQNN